MKEFIEKADVLIEALPYIKTFRHKVIVIKFGGSMIMDEQLRKGVLQDIVFLSYVGIRPVLVHGGGPLINQRIKALGTQPQFVQGLRVTGKKEILVIVKALSDLNKQLVGEIKELGGRTSGLDEAYKILRSKKHPLARTIGCVGEVTSVNNLPILRLVRKEFIPVVAPIGVARGRHNYYNINADQAGAHIASSLKAEKLILLTNVSGIKRDIDKEDSLVSTLGARQAEELIEKKVIQGGMIPKVRAAILALDSQVKKAHIIDGRLKHSLLLEVFTDKGIGTEIVKK